MTIYILKSIILMCYLIIELNKVGTASLNSCMALVKELGIIYTHGKDL